MCEKTICYKIIYLLTTEWELCTWDMGQPCAYGRQKVLAYFFKPVNQCWKYKKDRMLESRCPGNSGAIS